MKTALIIISIFLLLCLVYVLYSATYNTFSSKPFAAELAEEALVKAGVDKQTWKTALVASEIEVEATPEEVWEHWSRIEEWPEWSSDLHKSAKFTSDQKWVQGSTFEQILDLGVAGTVTGNETVKYVDEAKKVMWWKDEGGMKSCHTWVFSSTTPGKTKITNIEVFDGAIIGFMKPLLIPNWQKKFDSGLVNLAARMQ